MPMNKRFHAFYSGSVHGVGFRYTAQSAASAYGVDGWVMNLPDGRVELVCEGKDDAVARLFKKISDVFGSYISAADVREEKYIGEFTDFDIRFD